MEEKKDQKVRPIRRRVVWNMDTKEDTVEVPSVKTDIPNLSANPDEEPQDLLEFIVSLSTQRDNFEKENKTLKSQNEEMVASLKEVIESRDRALLNQTETLLGLSRMTDDAARAESQVKILTQKLEAKEMENRELNLLNSELRIKLTSGLQELGKTLEPKVEETEKLRNVVKTLKNDLVGKEREIEVLKSNSNTPRESPRIHSARLRSPVRPESAPISPRNQSLQSSSNQLPRLKLRTSTASPSTSSATTPHTKVDSTSELPPVHRSSRVSGQYSARQSRESTETPKIRQSRESTETPKLRQSISPRTSDMGGTKSVQDFSSDIKKLNQIVEELKEKQIQLENSCRSLEGLLDVEKLKYSNMKKEMLGKEKEIELLRKQKDAVKDELNEFIQRNSELTLNLETQTTKTHKLRTKLKKLKKHQTSGITDPTQNSESSESSESSEDSVSSSSEDSDGGSEEKKISAELEDVTRRFEERETKYRSLKDGHKKLQESLSSLVEKSVEVDSLKSSLEKMTVDIREKEKEILALRSSNKEPINAKIFKALAEEAQNEKTKALTLTNKVKQLTAEIQEKDKEIQSLKHSLSGKSSQQKINNSIKEEKEVENGTNMEGQGHQPGFDI